MMTTRRSFHAWLGRSAAAALLLAAGFGTAASAQDKTLNVVATTGMLGDTVRQVGGERVKVTTLMGVGVDPHTYRQTRSDIARLTRADLVVWHGLRLEAQLESLFHDLARRKRVEALAEAIPKDRLLGDEDDKALSDPHVWMDPALWQFVIARARDTLIEADPEGREVYEANAKRYSEEVSALEGRVKTLLQSVPEKDRVLVTAHDAFRYFGRANGYEVLGIQGISTESEASLHRVEALVKLLVERRIKAIFVESSVSDQNIRALIEGAAARGHKVVIGGELFSDAMGEPGTVEGTYIGMIEHNAKTVARALKGDE
ncbi:metal ABC transporter solute-binding protein, Zn/Mn family [Paracandidimonas soli]|uniref:Manganese/zinc/iron transport system substrate-binding protein n=1 Tax=Paracandidimonas soli TaxID=1917182 RepID=A0A4R3V2S0_9BURK|nr:zinc ABC transporter substrate-binding protein [Paracandidimonas soli]TCU99096.1 manganese/zinc/iron transport system substrate-binding protein [Paracandidimonas soli]